MGNQFSSQPSLCTNNRGSDSSSDSPDCDEECENEGGAPAERTDVDPQSPYAKSVCHLTECCLPGTPDPKEYHGTGFFGYFDLPTQDANTPSMLMYGLFTANHVLTTEFMDYVSYTAGKYSIKTIFDFIKGGEKIEFLLIPNGLIFTCPVLDLTFIQILDDQRNILINEYGRKFVRLQKIEKLDRKHELTVVQHPNAEPMKIATNKCGPRRGLNITHHVSTAKGSSGSPVFLNGTETVIGVHRGQSRVHGNVAICTDCVIEGIGRAYDTRGKKGIVGPPDFKVPHEMKLSKEYRNETSSYKVYRIKFKDGRIGYCTPTNYGWYWTQDDPEDTRRFDIMWLPMVHVVKHLADRDKELLSKYKI